MSEKVPQEKQASKDGMHKRNPHRQSYDFKVLTELSPELKTFVSLNKMGVESIPFANPAAVKALNSALLKQFYGVKYWDIPDGYLCPPIPGRADYIHHAADLLGSNNRGIVPTGQTVKVLDIGVGANAVYPIIGQKEYGWSFVGSDVDEKALASAKKIAEMNPDLGAAFELRLQKNPSHFFKGVVKDEEEFDLVICNPPFYSTNDEAAEAVERKWKNLGKVKAEQNIRNFGGVQTELFYPGGELAFISKMVAESFFFSRQCYWFTSLVSRGEQLHAIHKVLKKVKPTDVKTIHMSQGQKTSRIIAWTFMDEGKRKEWQERKFWN